MEIKNIGNTNEKGLFATKKYTKDERVHTLIGEIYDKPTRETIRIGYGRHIYDNYGIFLNHSFNPNIYIIYSEICALQDINIGDELVFNYNKNEGTMANPFYVDGILVCGNSEFDISPPVDFGKKITYNFKPAYYADPVFLTVENPQIDPLFTQIKDPLFLQKIDDGSSIDLEKK
jgi:hypothetical protein